MLLGATTGLQEVGLVRSLTVDGEAASAGINRMTMLRSTTNLTTPTAQTPADMGPSGSAPYIDYSTTATGEPTTAAAPGLVERALQAYGQALAMAWPGLDAPIIQGATAGNNEITLESTSGTNVITCHAVIEEL
ncbi:MAG: hypothetical protein A3E01_15400 [Gammaproteobacteria bacterium RIFCSPHIGHO2_12_FULL_63_22]|nr:MAG: hypothetical protein A3E01_15400 [Gammaproteobacteria bacterium RIFCSPHIGHO2_12_FULL_63_22]